MAKDDWSSRTRLSKLASVLYPGLADEDTRRQMAELARGEGKRPLLSSRFYLMRSAARCRR
jgi:hypothetical protein